MPQQGHGGHIGHGVQSGDHIECFHVVSPHRLSVYGSVGGGHRFTGPLLFMELAGETATPDGSGKERKPQNDADVKLRITQGC